MHNILMSALLSRTRKRADKVGDDSLTDSDLQALLNEVYGKLYTLIAEAGHRYFESTQTVSTTGAASYTIDATHLGTVRVERVIDTTSGRSVPLHEIGAQEHTYWRGLTGSALRYALVGQQLFLLPNPGTGETYKVYYIPQPPDLTTFLTTDNVDVVVPAGEVFLVNGAAVLAKGQTGGDTRDQLAEREKAEVDLIEWAALRNFNQAPSPFVEDRYPGFPDPLNPASYYWNPPK